MNIHKSNNADDLGKAAAALGSDRMRSVLQSSTHCNVILATGASQFEMLKNLADAGSIDWSRVRIFHLDEYLGMPADHPASFRRYLHERFISKIEGPAAFFEVDGMVANISDELQRLHNLTEAHPIDVAFIGIGENGHLAFNDPPADFDTDHAYIEVELDMACRTQQFNEGWFDSLADVPTRAISMSIKQILKSKALIVSVPDQRKAQAVERAVRGPISNLCPASILRTHPNCHLFLDSQSASLLV